MRLLFTCCLGLTCFAADKPQLNPTIQEIVRGVSESRMEATLKKLEAFGTRYILSPQDDPVRGIGAAQRWIYQEFQSYSPRLQVSYDTFSLKKGAGTRAQVIRDVDLANVVAVLPGTIHKDRYVLVTAHYDSLAIPKGARTLEQRIATMVKRGMAEDEARRFMTLFPPEETKDTGDPEATAAQPIAPGVTDDGSGTAAVLELARVMSKFEFDKSLVFIAFAAEEVGLEGSKAYAAKAKIDGMKIEAVLNNDIIGTEVAGNGRSQPRVVRVFAEPPEDSPSRALLRYMKDLAERYVPNMKVSMIFRGDRFLRGGDHASFNSQGYTAVRITSASENYDYQHSVEDTFAHTSVPYAARVARMNAAVAASLALAPSAPNVTWTYHSGTNKGTRTPMLTRGVSGYDAVLRWEKGDEPDIAGYAVVIRSTTSPTWEREISVGNVTEYRLSDLSIDDIVIGVKAIDRGGNQSLVSTYQPLQRLTDSPGQPPSLP
jgi:acetylornithine deacetylase/succinyl-diaminopimelate desuccinylase-like protein